MPDDMPSLFHQIFQEHYATVLRKIYFLVSNRNIAEDLAQEVFIRLYRNPPEDLNRIGPWLQRVLTRVAYDYLRTHRRLRNLEQNVKNQTGATDASYPSNEQILIRELENEAVQQVLGRLTERDRKALLLRHSGYSYAEIAEILHVNSELVGSILLRAAKRFKKQYLREEVKGCEKEPTVFTLQTAGFCRQSTI